ncbi:MAG: aminotransferase class IV [Gemmatimonadales bacterium]
MKQIVYWNGDYVEKDTVTLSPDDRGFLFGDGVYEIVRAYRGRYFRRDEHLARMLAGLEALEIAGPTLHDLIEVSESLLERNGQQDADAIIYWQVTRGAAPRTHWFPDPPVRASVYATTSPFAPKADPAVGISVITTPDVRWARCDIKTINLLPNCLANQRARGLGAKEAIFVRDGIALEGTATSFFGVFGGTVVTAPKSNYILPSITRRSVIDLALRHEIPLEEKPIPFHDLDGAEELFLAGTTMEVMPIVRVDGTAIGSGSVGPITQRLQQLFDQETSRRD